ncbi:MAG: methyltransferase domain-containing protein [Planctomycetes bacterium]|nr:methyltransferase domain-containing protein [Planctomycetota bacterium]MCB9909191.1 methyltransferase domain-containing protein [Planctomycetota bacterium]HRV80044.1 methyltransferase domain-containing protein [Planctomycetota bacterium]
MVQLLELPFDQYQRYRLVADLIEQIPGSAQLRILDVGGRTALLREFLPEHRVQLVDVESSDVTGLILGSGAALPFADQAFDVVCAFDTLEHVPVELRDAFVRECGRVARRFVFLAGPYEDPDVVRSEELLQAFLASKVGEPHRYLNEHRVLGLPDRQRVESLLREQGAEVHSIGHGRLDRWLLAMCLELYVESDPLLRPLGKPFYAFYNQMIYPRDHGAKVYRHVVVAVLDGSPMPKVESVLEHGEIPPQTEALLAKFAQDLLQVDREGRLWKPEYARLEGIIASLVKDLQEHKATLASTDADLAAHRATVRSLQADLMGHKETLATVEADLAEHRKSQENLLSMLAAEQEQFRLARSQWEQEHLNEKERWSTDLDRVNRLASDLNTRLVDQIAATKHQEALRDQAIQQAAELRSRLQYLESKASRRLALLRLLWKPWTPTEPHD